MDFATTEIDTIDRAKEYFQAMGCSDFHMSREYPDRYDEYRRLAISRKQERDWTCEAVSELAAKLGDRRTKPSILWRTHAEMEELVQNLRTVESLRQIYESTVKIAPRVPKRSKVLVAETIIGRSRITYRSGLVFLAWDLDDKVISRHLSEIASELATSARDLGAEPDRSQLALDTCKKVQAMLGLR